MCGIVGAVSLERPFIEIKCAKAMTDKIAHRGPDDAGHLFFHTGTKHQQKVSFFQNAGERQFSHLSPLLPNIEDTALQRELNSHDWDLYFGHRRLAIIDTTPAGHQPMSDLSKNIWLVYNGEIYNFKELRRELEKLGHRFKTGTDSEVIIYAYIEWGIESIHKFNGMFAFAIYDNFKKKLFLARDRYGIKPLYYTLTPAKTLIFASEVKSILEYPEYKSELDKKALLEYFTFQNIFTNKTLWQDIKILEAGHYIEIELNSVHPDSQLLPTKYWDFDFSSPLQIKDEREYIEELDRLFNQAVKRQLVADVKVGSYLSGGMDSGSITAIASNHFRANADNSNANFLNTFTVGFDLNSASGLELSFDERAKSEYMSYLFKTEHYEMVLKSGDMERCLPNFAYHLEEPRVGQSYPNYYAAKLASKFVKVVLSGAGGDELFAGYPWRYYRAVNNKNFDDYIDKYYKFWKRLIPNKEIKNIFNPTWDEVKDVWTRDIFKEVLLNSSGIKKIATNTVSSATAEDYINFSLYFEAKTFLHGLLVVEDKLSMTHSLETRVPFLDNDLVDFAQKIPVGLKLGNLEDVKRMDENEIGKIQKTNDGKVILRKAMSKYIPDDIHKAVKQGFSSPDNSWFKGESIEFVKTKLLNNNAKIYKYMDKDATQKLILEHLNGQQNRRLFIWSLLNFEEWCNVYE
jgi:asparagine synthase (glutamine-hydrolysing)